MILVHEKSRRELEDLQRSIIQCLIHIVFRSMVWLSGVGVESFKAQVKQELQASEGSSNTELMQL